MTCDPHQETGATATPIAPVAELGEANSVGKGANHRDTEGTENYTE